MKLFTIEVAGRPLLVFPEADSGAAEELALSSIGPDLLDFEADGEPLWDGEEKLVVREAGPDEVTRWEDGFSAAKAGSDSSDVDADGYAVLLVDVDSDEDED